MTPQSHPDWSTGNNTSNWIDLQGFGDEYDFQIDEWIGILFQFTGAGGGDEDRVGFFYSEGESVVNTWSLLKFYTGCSGTSGNGGWHIRHWLIRTEMAVELTGDRPPFIDDISEVNSSISTPSRPVTAFISDDNPSGGSEGVSSAQIIFYLDSLVMELDTVEMEMTSGDSLSGIWAGDLPGQELGSWVYWKLKATDLNGYETESSIRSYHIFNPTSNELIYYNQDYSDSWQFPFTNYYFYPDSNYFDIWPADFGHLTAELLAQYDVLIELTNSSGPIYIDDNVVQEWWGGDKTYIATGDDWLSARIEWGTGETYGVALDILGLTYSYGDINYINSGDYRGISRLIPNSSGFASNLANFLSDSLYLNYDPYYETGRVNWIDGFDVTDGYTIDMTAYAGTLDSNGNIWEDSLIFNVMVHGQAENGGKSAFLSFDPIALNTTPSYYWIGASHYWNSNHPNCPPNASPLISVYEELKGSLSVDGRMDIPKEFSIKGNYPNPFNPITNIHYELHNNTHLIITIYDVLGRKVKTLLDKNQTPGLKKIRWDSRDDSGHLVASGVYFYKVETDKLIQYRKMVLLK